MDELAKKNQELKAYIGEMKNVQGNLMPVMQKAQELFGYLSMDTMTMISEGLGVSVTEIYGVATFYAQFSLNPKGENVVSVCTGTACYVKGAKGILDEVMNVLGIKVGRNHAGRQVFHTGYTLPRLLRACAGNGHKRRRLRSYRA